MKTHTPAGFEYDPEDSAGADEAWAKEYAFWEEKENEEASNGRADDAADSGAQTV